MGQLLPRAFQRKWRTQTDTPERRADRAQSLVVMGEVSAGRHALEGAPLAPGTQRTLDQLRDPVRRPTAAYAPLPEALLNHHAERNILDGQDTLLERISSELDKTRHLHLQGSQLNT